MECKSLQKLQALSEERGKACEGADADAGRQIAICQRKSFEELNHFSLLSQLKNIYTWLASYIFAYVQRTAKVLVRGLVKFVPALAQLAGTNFTKPRTKTFADLCTDKKHLDLTQYFSFLESFRLRRRAHVLKLKAGSFRKR